MEQKSEREKQRQRESERNRDVMGEREKMRKRKMFENIIQKYREIVFRIDF